MSGTPDWIHLEGDDDNGYTATYVDPINPNNKINAIEMEVGDHFWMYTEWGWYCYDDGPGMIEIAFVHGIYCNIYEYRRADPPGYVLKAFRDII